MKYSSSMIFFACASLTPLVLLGLGLYAQGIWVWAGLVYMAVLTAVLDRLIAMTPVHNPHEGQEFPASDLLLIIIALGHLITLPWAIWVIAGGNDLALWERAVLFLGFGQFYGQVSNPAAHELIHRSKRGLFRLGMTVYITLLNGHHTSAHRLVHHVFVASNDDPNSAREGENFYHFLPHAYFGSFMTGLRAESKRRRHGPAGLHPYVIYLGLYLCMAVLAYLPAGRAGVLVWVLLGLYATAQLMLSDYVQHYGLHRATLPNGRLEPVNNSHSWNAPHLFSSHVMLNAPRHSDHHLNPARPYPALRLNEPDDMPYLPHSLPVCAIIALFPWAWRRMMRARLRQWQRTRTRISV